VVPVTFVRNIYWRWNEWRQRSHDTVDGIPVRSLIEQLHDVWRVEVKRAFPTEGA
jgi:hypothetical protein